MKKLLKENDWLVRALKTFVQAFIGAITSSIAFGFTDMNEAKTYYIALLGSALASGISAVWNVILEYLNEEDKING